MLKILKFNELTDEDKKRILERTSPEEKADVSRTVSEILDRVENEGESAVLDYTRRFDGVELDGLLAGPDEFRAAEAGLNEDEKKAFQAAAANIRAFHELQKESLQGREAVIDGAKLGYRDLPIEGAGVYVPGGTALYPSSVLMGVVPAVIAGIESPLLITPPAKDGSVHPAILYCAKLAGTDRVLKAGGAQGIAAAAFGITGMKARLIIGPGNRFVTEAKSQLSGRGVIRMDMPAGPSEVIVIADDTGRAEFVAADMLSQAEHGADSPAILLTNSPQLAEGTAKAIERGIENRPARKEMKSHAIREHGYAIVFDDLSDAFTFSNAYGPEHLEICTRDPDGDLDKITSAGSVFLGHYAPVALGDYYSGTNHVLPTGGAANFYSGLGVETFMKRITYQHPTRESLRNALEPIRLMSKLEGFDQEHGHSVEIRFSKDG